jgi:hypothetical protein
MNQSCCRSVLYHQPQPKSSSWSPLHPHLLLLLLHHHLLILHGFVLAPYLRRPPSCPRLHNSPLYFTRMAHTCFCTHTTNSRCVMAMLADAAGCHVIVITDSSAITSIITARTTAIIIFIFISLFPAQVNLKSSAIPLPLAPSNPAILPAWPQAQQPALAALGSSTLALNAKGQVTISGWLTPVVAPPHPSQVMQSTGKTDCSGEASEVAVLKRRRVSVHLGGDGDEGDDESHDDDIGGGGGSSSSSSSRQSSAPPSPKYDEGISFVPTPTPYTATPSSPSSASVLDIQLQVLHSHCSILVAQCEILNFHINCVTTFQL